MRSYSFDQKNSSFEALRNTPDQSTFVVSAHYQNPRATMPPVPSPTRRQRPRSRRSRRCRTAAVCSSATRTTSRSCRSRCPRGAPIRASAISRARSGISRPTRSSRRGRTTSTAGASRKRIRTPRCPSRRSRSCSGSTAPFPRRTAARSARASSSGTRRSRRSASRTRSSRSRQDADAAFDTYDARHSTVRWFVSTDAGFAIGPSTVDPRTGEILDAQVGIPGIVVAHQSHVRRRAGAHGVARIRRLQDRARARRQRLHVRERSACRDAVRARRARRARRDRARQPGSGSLRRRRIEGGRDARGRTHARPAAQLPGVHRVPAGEDFRPGVQPAGRHLGIGDGLQPVQHRGQGRVARRVCGTDHRSVRLLGNRIRVQAAAEGIRERGAREDRRARRDRSAARVLVGRGIDRRT